MEVVHTATVDCCFAVKPHGGMLCKPSCSVQVAEDEVDGSDDGFELAPTDAEATIMLLRSKLYPDPQKAAAAAAAAAQSRHSKRSKTAAGPSKAAAAAITAAAAAKQLPPIVLKSQLYTVLTDRTAADRDLERLRQSQRVRVFKLAIGGLPQSTVGTAVRIRARNVPAQLACAVTA
jgi:hypothetical protein